MSDFKHFIKAVQSFDDPDELEDFLTGLTTPMERDEFGRRLAIVKRLIAGDAQHKIAKDLGVGVATVTRGSKELKNGHFKYLNKLKV